MYVAPLSSLVVSLKVAGALLNQVDHDTVLDRPCDVLPFVKVLRR